ncbi:MAG: NADH-quinone oxidoreductase subunit D [Candidatus Marinimicrobia bacterium]|jgi:NADH-quinone oxidoreductase subunit D|nr:NADH-quinone oxidoreductase subunit D [Candidatus Neomarinimicrobiota bacterium]
MADISKSKYKDFEADRSKYPKMENGKAIIDLDSHKFTKIWQGPQHPGVTGNMSVELIINGDEIMKAKTHVGYLHRGFEKLLERRSYIQGFTIVCRICVPEPDTNEYCYSTAVEELAGIEIPEKAQWLRTLNLEMSRIGSFLMWIGGQAGAIGLGAIGQWTIGMRDFWLDLFEEMTGGRVYHMYMIPGGVRKNLPAGFKEKTRNLILKTRKLLYDVEKTFFNNAIVKSRLKGLGIITPEIVDEYGIVGPNARASGKEYDVRMNNPYLKYGELDLKMLTLTVGDAYARAELRYQEMHQSLDLISQILDKIPETGEIQTKLPNVLHWKIPAGQTYVKAESTRGEHGFYMVSDGTKYPRRVFLRGASYTHAISVLEKLAVNISISDLAALMVSLHTCPPEIER